MNNDILLSRELLALASAYHAGSIALPILASRAESLVEQMRDQFPTDVFSGAMNCVYRIGDINAVTLDENRQITDVERAMIDRQLDSLVRLVSPDTWSANMLK